MRWLLIAITTLPVITAIIVHLDILIANPLQTLRVSGWVFTAIGITTFLAFIMSGDPNDDPGPEKNRTTQKGIMWSMVPITAGAILLSAQTYV